MVLGRPVVSFPAGAVWTSTRPSFVGNCTRRRSAAATSCAVGNPDRGVIGLREGSISAYSVLASSSLRPGVCTMVCHPDRSTPSMTWSTLVYRSCSHSDTP